MSGINLIMETSLGPFTGTRTADGSSTLSTTLVKVGLPDPAGNTLTKFFRVRIVNLTTVAAGNKLAFGFVNAGTAAPTFSATPGTTSGIILNPQSSLEFTTYANVDMYVVGSAASTVWSVSVFLQ